MDYVCFHRLLDSIVHPVLTEPSPLDTDFEMVGEQTPRKSSMFITSSPVQSNLRKIAHLRNLTKGSEFNLLETPIVVKVLAILYNLIQWNWIPVNSCL